MKVRKSNGRPFGKSGMMGADDKIYLVEMGKHASLKDIVSIYGYAEIDTFPNTEEQSAFFNKWWHAREATLCDPAGAIKQTQSGINLLQRP